MFTVAGCGGYRHPDIIIRNSSYYPNKATEGKLTLVVEPYLSKSEQDMLFHYNAAKTGVYPVHLIFFNEGGETYDLAGTSIALIDPIEKSHLPLSQDEIHKLVKRSVFQRSFVFGTVGALVGTLAAPATALAGSVWGGLDTKKSNEYVKEMASETRFKQIKIAPESTVHGFIFFNPALDVEKHEKKDKILRDPYQLYLTNIQNEKGEAVNFSIYLPPHISENLRHQYD